MKVIDKESTKTALLKAGRGIIAEKGYNHTGIQEVLQAVGVPKGSFYHFFSSKEDFGLQILDDDAAQHDVVLEQYLGDETLTPITRLRAYFEMKIREFESLRCREGCLMATLGQELADQNETFRSRIARFFTDWRDQLAECLRQAQKAGEISTHWDTQELAEYCLNSWEGAIQQMKITKSVAPLQAFMKFTFESVLKG